MKLTSLCLIGYVFFLNSSAFAAEPQPPEEFGKAVFLRDYPTALKKAKADKKPLFVLFDEIPG